MLRILQAQTLPDELTKSTFIKMALHFESKMKFRFTWSLQILHILFYDCYIAPFHIENLWEEKGG